VKAFISLAKTAAVRWNEDFASSMGAALAYYTVFSIAPLLVIVIAIAAVAFGHDAAQQEILVQARDMLGAQGASVLEAMLKKAQRPRDGTIASALSIVALIFGAVGVFNELESDLNRIWKLTAHKPSGIWGLVRARMLSFGMIIAIGFLLLVSLLVSAALAAWARYWAAWFADIQVILRAANFAVSLAVVTVLFAMIYKFLPRTHVRWKDVWIGAAVTALLFTIGKFVIGLYLGSSIAVSSYGAAGALAILLLWVYYSAQIFLLGAEFTKAYADRHGELQQPA
jgi:YihY family inner membrane protein